jgi:hypothetical protein
VACMAHVVGDAGLAGWLLQQACGASMMSILREGVTESNGVRSSKTAQRSAAAASPAALAALPRQCSAVSRAATSCGVQTSTTETDESLLSMCCGACAARGAFLAAWRQPAWRRRSARAVAAGEGACKHTTRPRCCALNSQLLARR